MSRLVWGCSPPEAIASCLVLKYQNLTHLMDFYKRLLINVCIIETGGAVGATPQKYKLSICCNTPDVMAFKLSKSKIYGLFNEFLVMAIIIKCIVI